MEKGIFKNGVQALNRCYPLPFSGKIIFHLTNTNKHTHIHIEIEPKIHTQKHFNSANTCLKTFPEILNLARNS
jgi:hypothetical protein